VSSKLRSCCQIKYVHGSDSKIPVRDLKYFFIPDNKEYNNAKVLTIPHIVYIIIFTFMRHKKLCSDAKSKALRHHRALHPDPDSVQDESFRTEEFLDPRDRVQVKYEMLRQHRVEGQTVSQAAASFGVSRQSFYLAEKVFDQEGLPGLVPTRRGPKQAHKCTDEVLDFVEQWRQAPTDQSVSEAVEQRFGVRIHPRSIDRALARRKKKLIRREPRQ